MIQYPPYPAARLVCSRQRPGASARLLLAVFFCCFFLLPGCRNDESARTLDDLALAEAALRDRDTGDAEMYFERYLRKNAAGKRRWEVWQQLLSISFDIRQDKVTARDYLEIMLVEFGNEPEKRRQIQMQLAALHSEMRAYDRAVALWEALADDLELPGEHRAAVYRELSQAYLRRQEFSAATDMLDLCLQLDVTADTKADCLYALAETQMLTGELAASEKALRDLLSLADVEPQRRVLSVFMLGDVVEQLERFDEARELFESILDSYPNAKVVEIRLGALKEKKPVKKPPASRGKP